ncbi:MAG: LysM peptidoglycan-binding domain-containing protein [Flaviflexus sp.]|nr:LysM peptidoglycan-binding domain-containing protein [Flaviflexus sp.]
MTSPARRSLGMTVAATATLGLAPLGPATAAPAAPVELPSASYQVRSGDTLWEISKRFGVTVDTIAKHNGMRSSDIIHPGQRLTIPGKNQAPAKPAAKPKRAVTPVKVTSYTVQAGDTLGKIAAKHGVSVSAIVSASGLSNPNLIFPGQVLKIGGAPTHAAPKPATSKPGTAKPAAPTKAPAAVSTYTVQAGDTLGKIAAKHGVSVSAIVSASGLKNPNLIYPGQQLKLSGSAAKAPASQPATSTPATKPAAPKPAPARSYTVKAGDTLGRIAASHGVSVSSIVSASGLKNPNVIYPGQKLVIGAPGTKVDAPQAPAPGTTGNLVPDTFLHYKYPEATVRSANENKAYLNSIQVPTKAQIQAEVRQVATQYGVDPALALAHAFRESGFDARAVSPANAIGTMQVIPSSGEWASQLVGRKLNLLNPHDNIVAGVVIIRQLQASASSLDEGIAGYYQGLGSVRSRGMFSDTKFYVSKVRSAMAQFR